MSLPRLRTPSATEPHTAVPCRLSLSAGSKTPTLTRNTSAWPSRDGNGVDGGIKGRDGSRKRAFVWREDCSYWEMNPLRGLCLLISSLIARWQLKTTENPTLIYLRRQFIVGAGSLTKQEMPQAHLQQKHGASGLSKSTSGNTWVNHLQDVHILTVRGAKEVLGLLISRGILITCAVRLWPAGPMRVSSSHKTHQQMVPDW